MILPIVNKDIGPLLMILIPLAFKLFDIRSLTQDEASSAAKEEYINNEDEIFDFIVVGGGSAGAVVANRLSKKFRVLLLEGGGDPNPVSDVPYLQGALLGSSMDYQYESVPQKDSCLSFVDQKMQYPRGKALGGTSAINNMLYLRGNKKDFDKWSKIANDSVWLYKNLLPFFKRSEDYHGSYAVGDAHAVGNELYVGNLSYVPAIVGHFFNAVKEQGLCDWDFNAEQPKAGFMHPDFTIKSGRRWGTFQAFLQPILERKRLSIYRYSRAVKIHLDPQNKAYGVTYVRHGQTHFVTARKEIVVSAGAIDSPKLLMLSGIGPADHLQTVGIKPLIDLPVGQHLQDHVATFIGPILINEKLTFLRDRDLSVQDLSNYLANKTDGSPLTSPQERFANGFYTTTNAKSSASPDIYFIFFGFGVYGTYGQEISKRYKALPGVFEEYYRKSVDKDAFIFTSVLAKPKSTGEIKLASKDPEAKPLIDPKYFSNPKDMPRLVEGINWAMNFIESSEELKTLGARLAPNKFPGCESEEIESSAYWECYVRHFTAILNHPVGTCRMGSGLGDPKAVVDSHLRVLKMKGLRVADASIIPDIVNGNTHASSVMIGERAAQFILDEWAS